jgi:anthranilate synthase
MALQHKTMPIAAVQFHPESILTLPSNGLKIVKNALDHLKSDMYPVAMPITQQSNQDI